MRTGMEQLGLKLEIFEGPLDLLLHLIRKNELDIYDIPISLVTRQYLEYLEMMRELNIAVAGEFLVMAATLLHIKSQMLLPTPPAQELEPEEDPRQELVERLTEHMRYQRLAEQLMQRKWLDRDVFTRTPGPEEVGEDQGQELEVGVFELVEAFYRLVEQAPAVEIEISPQRPSVEERMSEVLETLRTRGRAQLEELVGERRDRPWLVATFLALLELARTGLVRLIQARALGRWGRIVVELAGGEEESG